MNEQKIEHVSGYEKGDVLVTLTYPQGGGDVRATLRVEDQRSGEMLVEVNLSPAQFMRAVASGAVPVSGARLPAHPERIGKRMQNTSTNIRLGEGNLDDKAEKQAATYLAEGWEQTRIDKTNFGRRVVAYRWLADDEE